ncbi:MAG TPA: methyltransferase domain-containing protein [Terracidiphilus sp.]|nr:methyltransferase domain-containing protein [Terracidiphilus sp.]
MTNQPNVLVQSADFEFAALSEAKNYRAALLHDFRVYLQGNVLEVGAGIGQMTSELRQIPEIKRLCSIEPDPAFCAKLLSTIPHHDLLNGTISDLKSETNWNAILSINVLEHIKLDIEELVAYHRLLRPAGGKLCLFVPARPEIYAPIDRDFGHFRRYTRLELHTMLKKAGFRIERLRYYNIVGYFAWWVSFCLLKKRSFDVAAVRWFDRAIFPVVHGFESRICPPPIGQSLIAVAVAE